MVTTLKSENAAGTSREDAAGLKNLDLREFAEQVDLDDGLNDEVVGDLLVSGNDVTSGLIEATRAIGTVLSVGLPALAFAGKPTLSCPHPKIKLVAEDIEGKGSKTTTRKGVKPKITKKQAEKAAKDQAEDDAKRRAERDLQTQQNGMSCAGKCKKIRGKIKTKLSKKAKIIDEVDNANGTTTFRAEATAEGSTTVQCGKRS